MNDIKTFLAWFEGFAENIAKQPTPQQWSKIKARIAALDAAPAAVVPAAQSNAPSKPPKPTTEIQWRSQYQAALMELGFDDASAAEQAGNVEVNMAADPNEIARIDAGPFLN